MAWSFVIKGISIVLGLVKVPILLAYLDAEKYGVWLTIASIIMWVHYFDLGLGQGLRNKFAESRAQGDISRAAGLVSTAYVSMTVIMASILILTLPFVYLLNWNTILNVTIINASELRLTVSLVLLMFILRFIFSLISVILKADQRPAVSDMFLPLGSLISLIMVILLKYFVKDSLFWASAALAIPPVLVLVFMSFYFFRKDYALVKPMIAKYNKVYLKDIYSLGIKFFLGQMLMLVMFSSSNIILTQIVNPQEVTIYNIARTYFDLPLTFFMIILTPYWSAITEAYVKEEMGWITRSMQKLKSVTLLFVGALLVMLVFSNFAFKIWIGESVHIPLALSVSFVVYNILVMNLSPYNFFINGVGKLNLGLRIAVFKIIAFLPVAIPLVRCSGAVGLVVALIIVNSLPNVIFNVLQYRRIMAGTAQGVWNR